MLARALEDAIGPRTLLGRAVPKHSSAWDGTSYHPPEATSVLAPKARFRPLGSLISIAPDPEYPWPEGQVKVIRRIDTGFVPLHRKLIYQDNSTGGIWTFHHHGCGRWDPDAQPDHAIVNAVKIQSGYGSDFKANIVERWFQNTDQIRPGTVRFANNLPAPFIPWGPWVLRWVMETCWQADAATKRRFWQEMDRRAEAEQQKRHEKLDAEADYVNKQEARYRRDLMDKMGEQDWKEFQARRAGLYDDRARVAYSLPAPKPAGGVTNAGG